MREGAHQGRNDPYPAQLRFTEATSAPEMFRTHGVPYSQIPLVRTAYDGVKANYNDGHDEPRDLRGRTRSDTPHRRMRPRAAGPAAAGGTGTRTSTRATTAASSATTGSSGARRSSTRPTAGLLGPTESLKGLDVLEIGAGAAQCSRWLAAQGARPVALDLSHRQLQHALRIGEGIPLVEADAGVLPFRDGSFDLACSAYGAVPFVADPVQVFREVHRVLRPGGRWVFSVTHPVRWAFPDEPGPEGLSVAASYFDRTPYVEQDEQGEAVYVEHHRTLGDRVRDVVAGGFRLADLVEPEWPHVEQPGVGRLVAAAGQSDPGDRDLRLRTGLRTGAAVLARVRD